VYVCVVERESLIGVNILVDEKIFMLSAISVFDIVMLAIH
jgi:hypothetical protein